MIVLVIPTKVKNFVKRLFRRDYQIEQTPIAEKMLENLIQFDENSLKMLELMSEEDLKSNQMSVNLVRKNLDRYKVLRDKIKRRETLTEEEIKEIGTVIEEDYKVACAITKTMYMTVLSIKTLNKNL